MPVVTATSENFPEKKHVLTVGISAFAGSTVSLRAGVTGIANKAPLIASLGHLYEIVETSLPKVLDQTATVSTPKNFALAIYPNPFNPSTHIRFAMKNAGIARLRIYNLNGQIIRELLNEYRAAGEHRMPWDGRDDYGSAAASGVYFIRFEAGTEVEVGKVMLVR